MPAGETYTVVEAPKGEFGVYLIVGRQQPAVSLQDPRARLRVSAGDRVHVEGAHAGRCRRDHRLDGHRFRRDRPVNTHGNGPPVEQPEHFEFTPENMERVQVHLAKYPQGRQWSAVLPLLDLAQRQSGGWLPLAAMNHVADLLADAAYPRLRGRDLLYDVQPAPGRAVVPAGLHDDAVLAARLRGGRRRLRAQARDRHGRNDAGRAVHAGRGRMPRRLRQRADLAGQ